MQNVDGIAQDYQNILVQEIAEATARLDRQVTNLLNISRLESGFLQPKLDWYDLNELIYNVLARLEPISPEHKITTDFGANLPLFYLDYGFMEQILYNLLYNAILYTPKGSEICIMVRNNKMIQGHFDRVGHGIGAYQIDNEENILKIVIEDDGLGFPEEELPLVFNKFYRLKNTKAGGTGLGLSIVKGLVEALHGTISLENGRDGGACFIILIPTKVTEIHTISTQ